MAVSAMGDPMVCYLDEPSTGMDALHRRQVWNVIQKLRTERLVVLTTHSMVLTSASSCIRTNIL